jgi:hypothetical protein
MTITAVNGTCFSKLSDTFFNQMPIGEQESTDVFDERTTSLCEPLIQSRRTDAKSTRQFRDGEGAGVDLISHPLNVRHSCVLITVFMTDCVECR